MPTRRKRYRSRRGPIEYDWRGFCQRNKSGDEVEYIKRHGPSGFYALVWWYLKWYTYDRQGLLPNLRRLANPKIKTLFDAAYHAQQLVATLKDPYSYLWHGKQLKFKKASIDGNFIGVGIVFYPQRDSTRLLVKDLHGSPLPMMTNSGLPVIGRVLEKSSAKRSGLRAGDVLLNANFRSLIGKSQLELEMLLSGSLGREHVLTVQRGEKTFRVNLKQTKIALPAVSAHVLPGTSLGYLRFESFMSLDMLPAVEASLLSLNDCEGIIIDLRQTYGGALCNVHAILSSLMDEGVIGHSHVREPHDDNDVHSLQTVTLTKQTFIREISRSDNDRTEVQTEERKKNVLRGRPLAILVDGNTRSASEMIPACLKEHGLAIIVGTPTYGKGIGQCTRDIGDLATIAINQFRWYTPNNTWLGDAGHTVYNGLQPDIFVAPNVDCEFGRDSDNQLQAAIAALN